MTSSRGFLREGDQFVLDLFPGEPWGGRSPRWLTRVGSGLFLRQEPPRHEVDPDPSQLSLRLVAGRPQGRQGPRQDEGAPSLLPLGARRRRRARLIDLVDDGGEDYG